ncbi:MAG: TIGR03790 family protein [Verrucomicrobiota bacterium]
MDHRFIQNLVILLSAICIVELQLIALPKADLDMQDMKRRTVVVANLASDESMALARYYAERRGIPGGNIIYVNTSIDESISWDDFIETIFNPLRIDLVSRGWIKGRLSPGTDDHGRIGIRSTGTRIAYLVTTWGIPYKLNEDKERIKKDERFNTFEWKQTHTARAAVDSELALLAMNGAPVVSVVPNPYHKRETISEASDRHIKVSRIDGPSFEISKRIIDDALFAERNGLNGRAYIDRGGPYPMGDAWLSKSIKLIKALGYPLSTNFDSGLAGLNDRFDDLAIYLGWYESGVKGALAHSDFRFQRGAIAIHIHSFSGNFRRANSNWSGPLLAKGAAVTIGNVAEPYLEQTQHLDLLMEALSQGWPVGDAMYYSLPSLSWAAMQVGDPLYRPFYYDKTTSMTGLLEKGELAPREFGYRAVRNAEISERKEEARAILETAWEESPSLVLADALGAKEIEDSSMKEIAASYAVESFEVGLGLWAAQQFNDYGRKDLAVEIVKELLESNRSLPVGIKRTLWKKGIHYAKGPELAEFRKRWQDELKADKQAELEAWNAETKRIHQEKMERRKNSRKSDE